MSEENKLIVERKKKLQALSELTALYPNDFKRNTTVQELVAKYEDKSKEIERTVCWGHLETLNRCLPGRYKAPTYLMALIKRDIDKPNNY